MIKKYICNSKGLTLIEVLASLTILGIILISIMNFFSQAYSFTNNNQTKTVAVNVARNALMFMENESFIAIREKFRSNPDEELQLLICDNQYKIFWKGETSDSTCSPITINNVSYNVTISSVSEPAHEDFFIPLKAVVTWDVRGTEKMTEVEGGIKSEDIR